MQICEVGRKTENRKHLEEPELSVHESRREEEELLCLDSSQEIKAVGAYRACY